MAYHDKPKAPNRNQMVRCPQCNTQPPNEILSVDSLGLDSPGVSWTCLRCECVAFSYDESSMVPVTLRQPYKPERVHVNNLRYRQ